MGFTGSIALPDHVLAVAETAVQRGVPRWLADEAADIARSRLAEEMPGLLGPLERRRVHGYFWGVVRRRCFESGPHGLMELRERFIEASLAPERGFRSTGRRARVRPGRAAVILCADQMRLPL